MKSTRLVLAIAALSIVAACATSGAPPTDSQVARIQTACAIDAGIRPTVTALMVLATPAEVSAINVARSVIDPICANPSAPIQANGIAAFTSASGQVLAIVAQLQARKASGP